MQENCLSYLTLRNTKIIQCIVMYLDNLDGLVRKEVLSVNSHTARMGIRKLL